jgi:hypothetical protein
VKIDSWQESRVVLQLWRKLKKMQIFETIWSHNETWLFQYISEAKHQSVQWKTPAPSSPKTAETSKPKN